METPSLPQWHNVGGGGAKLLGTLSTGPQPEWTVTVVAAIHPAGSFPPRGASVAAWDGHVSFHRQTTFPNHRRFRIPTAKCRSLGLSPLKKKESQRGRCADAGFHSYWQYLRHKGPQPFTHPYSHLCQVGDQPKHLFTGLLAPGLSGWGSLVRQNAEEKTLLLEGSWKEAVGAR